MDVLYISLTPANVNISISMKITLEQRDELLNSFGFQQHPHEIQMCWVCFYDRNDAEGLYIFCKSGGTINFMNVINAISLEDACDVEDKYGVPFKFNTKEELKTILEFLTN